MVKYCGKLHQPTGGIKDEIVRFCYKKKSKEVTGGRSRKQQSKIIYHLLLQTANF